MKMLEDKDPLYPRIAGSVGAGQEVRRERRHGEYFTVEKWQTQESSRQVYAFGSISSGRYSTLPSMPPLTVRICPDTCPASLLEAK